MGERTPWSILVLGGGASSTDGGIMVDRGNWSILLRRVGCVRCGLETASGCWWHRREEVGRGRQMLGWRVGEGLVFAEVGDGQSEWVDRDEIVGHFVHDDELDMC